MEHGHNPVLRLSSPFESPSWLPGSTATAVTDSRPAATGVTVTSVTARDKGRLGAQKRNSPSDFRTIKSNSKFKEDTLNYTEHRKTTKTTSHEERRSFSRHNIITREARFLVTPTASSCVLWDLCFDWLVASLTVKGGWKEAFWMLELFQISTVGLIVL